MTVHFLFSVLIILFLPLEGFHHLAEQTFQVEDFLHQEAFHSCLLSAGRVDALSRLPPNQDLMLEFWRNKTNRAGEKAMLNKCSLAVLTVVKLSSSSSM